MITFISIIFYKKYDNQPLREVQAGILFFMANNTNIDCAKVFQQETIKSEKELWSRAAHQRIWSECGED